MAKITIFRQHSVFTMFIKWRVYANNKIIGKVANCKVATFSLPAGRYQIEVDCPDFPIVYRKKGMHSNILNLHVEEHQEYNIDVRPHPLFWWGQHHPHMGRLFTPVECLLLLPINETFQDNLSRLERLEMQIRSEINEFKYHLFTWFFVFIFITLAIVSNICYPHLYETGDGMVWGFLLGFSELIGFFSGKVNKQMMARGWEYKTILFSIFGCLMLLFIMAPGYNWLRISYFFLILVGSIWAINCFRHWKKQKSVIDMLENKNLQFLENT